MSASVLESAALFQGPRADWTDLVRGVKLPDMHTGVHTLTTDFMLTMMFM